MRLPTGFANLFPYLVVQDAAAFFEFIGAAFDATVIGVTEREGRVANARVRIGDVQFMVTQAGMLPAMTGAYYLFVDDADAVHARALANGATEVFAPADMDYGDRQGGVRDPFGNLWFVSTRLVDGSYED